MGIETHWGFTVGSLPHGPRNLISDVPGVTVGHCTLADGDVQTGVTALLPHPGDTFHEKVPAAAHVINGFGKTTGRVQIEELGTLETPILFTNTLQCSTAAASSMHTTTVQCSTTAALSMQTTTMQCSTTAVLSMQATTTERSSTAAAPCTYTNTMQCSTAAASSTQTTTIAFCSSCTAPGPM